MANPSPPKAPTLRGAFNGRLIVLAVLSAAALVATLTVADGLWHAALERQRAPEAAQLVTRQTQELDASLQREIQLLARLLEASGALQERDPQALARRVTALIEEADSHDRFSAYRLEGADGAVLFSRGESQSRPPISGTGPLRWAAADEGGQVYRVAMAPVKRGDGTATLEGFMVIDARLLASISPHGTQATLRWRGRSLAGAGQGVTPPAHKAVGGAEVAWSGATEADVPMLALALTPSVHSSEEGQWKVMLGGTLVLLLLGWVVFGRWSRAHADRVAALASATARFSDERDADELRGDALGVRMRGASVEIQRLWRSLQSLARNVDQADEAQQAAQQYLRDLNVYLEQRIDERTRELAEARDRALDSTRAKEQFLANMSHELRTPLTGLLGGLELVDPKTLPEQQRHLLQVARQSGEALLSVINEVLDYSKLEAGKFVLAQVPFRVSDVAREAASLFAAVALRKGVALDCVCEPGVETAFVGDPLRLRQVLLNLLGNALKFTDHGQVELRITRIARRHESAVLLFSVRDSGIGIPPTLQTQLFKPFIQAEEGAARKGTGLGLAISQKLVQAMGGEITVESLHGRGSTFSFDLELPFAPADALAAPAKPTVLEPERSLHGRVLLVEDNPVNRLVATTMLAPMGLDVTECEDGRQALERLREQAYDLVLMDCQMPVLDGFGATAAIRGGEAGVERSRVPIVAFTANALDGDAERCLAAGMDGYLAKPFTREQLAAAVGIWLGATSAHGLPVDATTVPTSEGPAPPVVH